MSENRDLLSIVGQSKQRTSDMQRPLHVLTLTPFYPSENDDAAGCFISEPLDALAELGVVNTVFAVQPFYRGTVRARQGGLRAQWLRYFSLPGGIGLPTAGAFVFARLVPRVRDLHRSQRIDLIHAHGPLPCGHAAMLLAAELSLPYVVSVHGLDAYSANQVGGRAGQWCRRISQRIYRSARRVVCISERVREEVLKGSCSDCRTSVVYNSVDSALFSPGNGPAGVGLTVLSVANLIPIKAHDVLLRAIGALTSEFPTLNLQIIGEGSEEANLRAIVGMLRLDKRVSFAGRRSRREVAAAMQECTVFALPSRYEGLGCVYLEAMSVGKPVIGCRGQGIAEIIQHGCNGVLVGPDNERELALAMALLLRDETSRRKLGVAARDTILEGFTLAHQAEKLKRIYRESAA